MKNYISALFLGALSTPLGVVRAQDPFADQVISYTPGTGINTSFETPSAALGAAGILGDDHRSGFLPIPTLSASAMAVS